MPNMRTINVFSSHATCDVCGSSLLDIKNIKYSGICYNSPTCREEVCICRNCETRFILKYELFTEDGHINRKIFSGDANDLNHNWQDNLTDEQKKTVGEHLKGCPICSENLNEEMLSDAWFSSIVHKGKNHENQN